MPILNTNLSFASSTLEKAIKLVEGLSDINPRRDVVRYKVSTILGHRFEPVLLTGFTYCSHCNKLIWIVGQACKLCKLSTHKKCMQSTSWHCRSMLAENEQQASYRHEEAILKPARSVGHQMQNEHKFEEKFFFIPTYCDHCGTLIKGVLGPQGLLCDSKQGGCGKTVHKECKGYVHKHCGQCNQPAQVKDIKPDQLKTYQWNDGLVGIKDFEILSLLGAGSFSKVYLAKLRSSNQEYAIKVVKKTNCVVSSDPESVLTEMRVLNFGRNFPFLTIVHCCFQSEDRLFFVLEYATGEDLYHYLQKYRKFSEDWTRFYSAEIVLALEYLHSQNIIHRDLKLENVKIDKHGHCKLLDFGMSKDLAKTSNGRTRTFCGTPIYMSPEMLRNEDYGYSVDWWTLGVLMYQLMVGFFPFDAVDDVDELQCSILNEEIRIPESLPLSDPAKSILYGLLEKDPRRRLGCKLRVGAREIEEHPFFHVEGKTYESFWRECGTKKIKPPFVPTHSQTTANGGKNQNLVLTPISKDKFDKIEQAEFRDFEFCSDSFRMTYHLSAPGSSR